MACQMKKLGDFCTVMTGVPTGRARKLAEGQVGTQVKVLSPRAMENGRIIDAEIAFETVSKVKEDFFTKEGDVLVKASTPYDCVYIDAEHQGMLVTSFALILRAKKGSMLNMRYLAMYLNQPQARERLQELSIGVSLKLIKKAALEGMDVPIIPEAKQAQLVELCVNTQKRKELCLKLIQESDKLLQAEFSRIVLD